MNSLFGKIWNIASQTGYSQFYIIWKIPYVNWVMQTADAPRYTNEKKSEKVVKITSKEQADALFEKTRYV